MRRGARGRHMAEHTIYDYALDRNAANHVPLSPLSFIQRTAAIYPDYPAVSYNGVRRTWAETYDRTRRLAGALAARGVGRGDLRWDGH